MTMQHTDPPVWCGWLSFLSTVNPRLRVLMRIGLVVCAIGLAVGTAWAQEDDYWDTPFSYPKYLIHYQGLNTTSGYVEREGYYLYSQPAENNASIVGDGTGGTFTYHPATSSGPYNTPREVCAAVSGLGLNYVTVIGGDGINCSRLAAAGGSGSSTSVPIGPIAVGVGGALGLGLLTRWAIGRFIRGAPPLPAKDKESEYLDRAVHQMMCGRLQYPQRELMRIRDQYKQVLDEQKMLDDTVRQAQQMVNETRRSWQRAATIRDVGDQLWFPITLIGTLIWGYGTGPVGRLGSVLSAVGVEFAWAAGGARIPSFPKPESVESAMARIKEVDNFIYEWYEEQFGNLSKLNKSLDDEYDRVKGNYDRLRDDIAAYEDKMRKAGMKFKSCLTAGG